MKTAPLWAFADVRPSNVDKESRPGERAVRLVNYTDVYNNQIITSDLKLMVASASDEHIERFSVLPGDIIITKDSETPDDIGIPAQIGSADDNMVCAYHLTLLRPWSGRTYPRYLYWALESNCTKGYWLTSSFGVTRYSIGAGVVSRLPIGDVDLDSQRAIADYLDLETGEIDAMIDKMNELAMVLRRRVAHTTLVFGLNGGEREAYEESHSPLAGIPAHWGQTKFGYDFTESTERNGDDPPGPLLSISEYRGVELNIRTEGQQPSEDVTDYRVVRPGQLAANMMWLNHGGLGVSDLTGYISPDYKSFWISDRFDPRYVHYLFRSPRYVSYFGTIATGVRPNAQRVTKTALDMVPIPLPPLDEQRRIADHLDEDTGKIDAMLEKVAELKSLLIERRAALITDVVSGRKKVA